MKKYFFFALTAAMMSFAGCQEKELEAPVNPNQGGSTFELVAEIDQDETKTTLTGRKVEWEEGDVIYVVTEDEEWGAAYENKENTNLNTIAEFVYGDGKFTTEASISAGKHVFNAMYTRADQKTWHRGAGSSHSLLATQSQDCTNPTAHIKLNDALVGTFTVDVPQTSTAQVDMHHIYTLMQVNVKNNTGNPVEVTKFEMTAEGADLAGIFNVTSFKTPSITAKEGEAATETITVNVTGGAVDAGNALPIYFVMAPLSDYTGDVTFKVTAADGKTYTKTTAVSDLDFNAGAYNTTPYTISEADVVEPEPEQPGETTEAWTLVTDASTLAVGDEIVIVAPEANYAMGADKGSNRNAAGVSKSGNTVEINDDVQIITLQAGNKSNTFAFYTGSGYLYAASSSSNNLKTKNTLDDNGSWSISIASDGLATITANGTYSRNTMRFNPNNDSPLFSCYASTQTLGTLVSIYKHVGANGGGGETPTIQPRNLAFSPATATATVGQPFTEPTLDGVTTGVEYTSSNTAVATVNVETGAVTLVAAGTTTIKASAPATAEYEAGEASYTLTVSAAVVDDTDYSGTYAIVAYRSSEELYYYLTNVETTTSTKRLTAVAAGNALPEDRVTVNGDKLWRVAKSGSTYTVQSVASSKYVAWKSGNSAIMSDEGIVFNLEENEGTFHFVYTGSEKARYLSLNNTEGNDYFAMYEGTISDLYLIPATEGEEAVPELIGITVNATKTTFTVGEEFAFAGTVTANYSNGTTKDVTTSAAFSGYDKSQEGPQTITVTYGGKTATYGITVNPVQSGGDEPDQPSNVTESLNIYANKGTLNNKTISWTGENFVCSNSQASSTTAIRTTDSTHYRVYAKSVLNFTAKNDKKFKTIVVNCESGYADKLKNSTYPNGVTASYSGNVVTITAANPVSEISITITAQTRINKVTATLN